MKLWTMPLAKVGVGVTTGQFAKMRAKLVAYLKSEDQSEADISRAVSDLSKGVKRGTTIGRASGIRGSYFTTVRKLTDAFRQAQHVQMDRTLAEVTALMKSGLMSYETAQKILELERKRLDREAKEAIKKVAAPIKPTAAEIAEAAKAKAPKDPAQPGPKKGLLGESTVTIIRSPRPAVTTPQTKAARKDRMIFGPWWTTPKTEWAECDLWKSADLYYQKIGDAQKDILKDCMYNPKMSTYDHFMAYAMTHCLHGILPAPYPFKVVDDPPGSVYAKRAGVILAIAATGVISPGGFPHFPVEEALDFLAKYSTQFAAVGAAIAMIYLTLPWYKFAPASFSNRKVIFPYIPAPEERPPYWAPPTINFFDPQQLYAAFVGIWNDQPPPGHVGVLHLVTVTLRTSHWRQVRRTAGRPIPALAPSRATFGIEAVFTDPPSEQYTYYDGCVSNADVYLKYCLTGHLERVRVLYAPGKLDPLTIHLYRSTFDDRGVYASQGDPKTATDPPPYWLGDFDGLHAWAHWPWTFKSSRYDDANPPAWWTQKTLVHHGITYPRVRPPHPYTGHPLLRPG